MFARTDFLLRAKTPLSFSRVSHAEPAATSAGNASESIKPKIGSAGEFARAAELDQSVEQAAGGAIGEPRQFRRAGWRNRVVAEQKLDHPPGALGPQFGRGRREVFLWRAPTRWRERGPRPRPSRRRRPRRRPNPDRLVAGACRLGRGVATDARSPSAAAEPAHPSRGAAPGLGRAAKARKSLRPRTALRIKVHRRGARGRGRRERMFGVRDEVPQWRRRAPRSWRPPQGRADRRRFATSARRAALGGTRPGATADGCVRRGWSECPAAWAKMFGVAQRGKIFAMARQGGAGGRGAQGQALTQCAGERRIAANNLIQQSEPGAGAESRVSARAGSDGWLFWRPRPGRKRLFQHRVGRRGTRRGAPARPPPGGAKGASPRDRRGEFRRRRRSAGSNRTMV